MYAGKVPTTHHDHPDVGFRLMEDLSQSLSVHCLTWLHRVEGLGEVDQGLTKSYVSDLPVQSFLLGVVVEDLQVLLKWHGGEAVP